MYLAFLSKTFPYVRIIDIGYVNNFHCRLNINKYMHAVDEKFFLQI